MVKNISGANQDILSWIKENQYEQLNSFLSQHGNHERDSLLNSISITPLGVLRTNLDVLLLLKDRGMQFTRDAETMLQIKSYFNPRSKDNPNTDNPETSASQSPENKISSNIGFFALLSALGSIIKDFFSNKPGIAVKDEQKVSAVHKPQQTQSGHDSLNNSHEKMKNAFVPGVQRKDIRSIIPNPEPLVVIDDAESKNDSANIEPEDPLLGDLEEGSGRFEAKQVSLTSKSRTTQRKTSDNKTNKTMATKNPPAQNNEDELLSFFKKFQEKESQSLTKELKRNRKGNNSTSGEEKPRKTPHPWFSDRDD